MLPKGVEEKDVVVRRATSEEALCATRQEDILQDAWAMLEVGGVLIYSTCTYNIAENEGQLASLQSQYELELLRLALDPTWGVWEREEGVYRFMPHRTQSEGLTLFAVRKLGGSDRSPSAVRKGGVRGEQGKAPQRLTEAFAPDELYQHGTQWYHLSREGQAQLQRLQGVRILSGGVPLGELKGQDFIPHHAWAGAARLRRSLPFPELPLTTPLAFAFLKREAVDVEGERGIHLASYEGVPLGFLKLLGNRANNLYPKELMIRNSRLTLADVPVWK